MRRLIPRLSWVVARCGMLLAFQLVDRVLQHAGVHFKAHGLDMAALLPAQHIARTAQLEIERGDLEAGAEVGELLQRGQPPARDLGQLLLGGNQQVGIGAAVGSADPVPAAGRARRARGGRRG